MLGIRLVVSAFATTSTVRRLIRWNINLRFACIQFMKLIQIFTSLISAPTDGMATTCPRTIITGTLSSAPFSMHGILPRPRHPLPHHGPHPLVSPVRNLGLLVWTPTIPSMDPPVRAVAVVAAVVPLYIRCCQEVPRPHIVSCPCCRTHVQFIYPLLLLHLIHALALLVLWRCG